ncbi:glycosyltransferase family 2 protein [Paracoccus jeotgali]|uniref:Glycosyltransferase 2-like domain-containing protein n=1 Tax=Paracoccus jeotgali TaxID=2065379 RepID=A0A2K9MJR7_9RHOB|nr:glycosyltransferase family 2 protein [Paracoccus jeotgali]AUM75889.1 hypothetical protein CYR75_15860 [Paracoccus jeotgali]
MTIPKISVIVPLYNTERYLTKCLESIMAQTLREIEIICVDDCSPDKSAELVSQFAKQDKRVRLIRHDQNAGLGGARNTGIINAHADYVASVDSDDFIEPDFLEALWQATEEGRFDVVVCGYKKVDAEGRTIGTGMQKVATMDPIPKEQDPFKISDPAFWNKLWRKSLFTESGIFFPDHIYHQDSATTPRIYTKAKNVKFIGGTRYNYLIRPDSVTQSVSDKHLIDRFRCVDVLKEFFIEQGIYEDLTSSLTERIYSGYSYHVGNVIKNRHGGDSVTDAYLRHLLIMREGYLEHDMTVRMMSLEEKADYLLKHKPIPRVKLPAGTVSASAQKEPEPRPPLPSNPRIMVLTLFSGENEFEECCSALDGQVHKNWDHKVFRGLGNHQAHRSLYQFIMDNNRDYDLFFKLDADMVFSHSGVLCEIIKIFRDRPALDHLIVACDDYMTGERILGVHTFSGRVRWRESSSGIFNDPNPACAGTRRIIRDPASSFFKHASDPSSLQAFHFGAHRALKLVQRGYSIAEKRVAAMQLQWDVLNGLWRQYKKHGDRRHILALVAADLVIRGKLGDGAHDYHDPDLLMQYDVFSVFTGAALAELVRENWDDEERRVSYFNLAVGPEGLEKLKLEAA